MPNTHRTPPHTRNTQGDPPQQNPMQEAGDTLGDPGIQDIDFHGDVVRVVRAGDVAPDALESFKTSFRNKNAHIKRTITRATNLLTPLEAGDIANLHSTDIHMLRDHLKKIENAINSLHSFIDDHAHNIQEDNMDPFIKEADSHVPPMLDIRTRVNALDKSLQASLIAPTPPQPLPTPEHKAIHKVDNTFRPRPLDKHATPARFNKWKREFNIYVRRNGFDNAPIDEQRVLLNNSLTPEMEEALERLCLPERDASLESVINSLEEYLEEKNNLTAQRFAYFKCVQKEGESIEQFIMRFRRYGDYADFDKFSYDENMICKLLTGIKDSNLRKELLRLPKSDFATFKKFAITWEASHTNNDLIEDPEDHTSGVTEDPLSVDKVSAYRANKRSTFNAVSSQQSSSSDGPQRSDDPPSRHAPSTQQQCYYCGLHKHASSECPARDKVCNYCSKKGHFSKVCRKAKADRKGKTVASKVHNVLNPLQPDDPALNVGHLDYNIFNIDNRIQAPTPKIAVAISLEDRQLGNHLVIPDTGAAVSVLPLSLVESWKIQPQPLVSSQTLINADGSPINCVGTLSLNITHKAMTSNTVFFVCEGVRNVLLSWMTLRNIAVVPAKFPDEQLLQQSVAHVQKEVIHEQLYTFKRTCFKNYPKLFNSNALSVMKGPPMHIYLKQNIQKTHFKPITRPRPIPMPLRDKVYAKLMDMLQQGIIRKVEKPTDFVSPLVVVPKKNNDVRLVVDYNQVNQFIKRPTHPFPSMEEVRALIPPSAKYFATLDAVQGYLQIPLHPDAQLLTTFITPWGRYCFKRAPMGLSCSGDVFCARGDEAFQGIPNLIKVVDDLLVFSDDLEGIKRTIIQVLEAASSNSISLSFEKFNIATRVDFVGYTISHNSIQPDAKHFEALRNFPTPRNKTDLRSFLGLTNQFSPFSSKIASIAKPLRPLLSKTSQWHWDPDHQEAFNELRKELVRSSVLNCFDPHRKTRLLTDASRLNGLGFALMQYIDQENKWCLISCGSRFITDTEANYAVFELEALAIVWAVLKCRLFLLGLPSFQVITDHRPLVGIFNSTRLAKSDNTRIVRLLQKVAMYSFEVVWTPGKTHSIPDALSRAPLQHDDAILRIDTNIDKDVSIDPSGDSAVNAMAKAASIDHSYQDVVHAIKTMHLKEMKRLPLATHAHVRVLASLWDRISVDSNTGLVLLDTSRILVPKSYRNTVIERVHLAHQGITRTKARMQALYFWPGMHNQIIQAVQACQKCQHYRDEQPGQPLALHPLPLRPFHFVSLDIFEFHRVFFMTYVDRYSGWPSVASFQKSPSSTQVISALINIFKDFGIPDTIRHDGATPFVSEQFKAFLSDHHINDQVSSAYNPASNGHAEASVKAMKALVKKHWIKNSLDQNNFAKALLEWRNVPRYPGNLSPAELIFSRKTRTGAPCISYDAIPHSHIKSAVSKNHEYLRHAYNKLNCYRRKSLPPLAPGDRVKIRDTQKRTWDRSATVIETRHDGRSYILDDHGKRLLRNRRFLLKTST